MNKREIVSVFRNRLTESMSARAMNQSSLARAAGIDRSTLYNKIKRYRITKDA